MWIQSVKEFSVKTLQKWATLPKNEKNFLRNQFNITIKLIPIATETETTTTTTTIIKHQIATLNFPLIKFDVTLLLSPILSTIIIIIKYSYVSISSLSSLLQNFCFILLSTVIKKLSFLMNDIRIKFLYKTIKTTNNKNNKNNKNNNNNNNQNKKTNNTNKSNNNNNNKNNKNNIKTISNNKNTNCFNRSLEFGINSASSTIRKLFKNKNNSNHRTYNNSSKSNKVFLHYTSRDPRLWIFNCNQFVLFNKHFSITKSELRITEDLCNYGEVIGGPSLPISVEHNIVYRENIQEKANIADKHVKFSVKNNKNFINLDIDCGFRKVNFYQRIFIGKDLNGSGHKSDSTLTIFENFCCTFKSLFTVLVIV